MAAVGGPDGPRRAGVALVGVQQLLGPLRAVVPIGCTGGR